MLATVILYFCCIVHFSSTCIFIFGYILVYLILVTGPPVDSGPAAHGGGGGGRIFYNGLCGETTPEGCTFFRLQVYERGGISPFEVYERGGKSVMSVCKRRNRAKSS